MNAPPMSSSIGGAYVPEAATCPSLLPPVRGCWPHPLLGQAHDSEEDSGAAQDVKSVDLRLLLSGAAAGDAVEVKLNGVLLPAPTVQDDGWRILKTTLRQFAVGRNLVHIRLGKRSPDSQSSVTIEKLEVHVTYSR